MSYRSVIPADTLWDNELLRIDVNGVPVLLARIEGTIVAYRDVCAHKGVPLSNGTLCGRILTCSAHGWQYDIAKGCGINPASARLIAIPLRVQNGNIEVDVVETIHD